MTIPEDHIVCHSTITGPLYFGGECVIILEDLDFRWHKKAIKDFREMWVAGISIVDMEHKLKRPQDEIALLILHEKRHGKIKDRPGGIYGGWEEVPKKAVAKRRNKEA